MAWDVRELDVDDDAEMHRMYEIVYAASQFEREGAPTWSERESTLFLREDDPAHKITGHAAFAGDDMVGTAVLVLPQLDNLDKAFLEIWVEPERRRRGIGSEIADHLAERARTAGRMVLLGQSSYPIDRREDHRYRCFAEKNGFQLALTQIRRDLALPVPAERVGSWIDEAAPHHVDYRIETYLGTLPTELVASFVHVMNQLALDAPQGDESWEEEALTPEAFEQRHRNNVKADRRVFHTIAVHRQSNEVVAYTTLAMFGDDDTDVHQWGTLVLADHRGHRLGLAVKARALADLQRAYPDRTRITTMNAEVNAQMVGINERMGFTPIEIVGEFQRKLA